MSRYLYVDWENVWIGLRCLGYSVEPSTVVTALVRAAFGDAHEGVRVAIVTTRGLPTRLERRGIEAAVLALTGVRADVRIAENRKDDAVDIELAFWVGRRTCDLETTELAIASSDADLVDVARLAKQAQPSLPVTLAFLERAGHKLPAPGQYRLLRILTQPEIGLPPPVESSSSANEFDKAAWALAMSLNAVPHSNEARALHPDDAPHAQSNLRKPPPPTWWSKAKDPRDDVQALHDVDHVLWEVQRFFDPKRRRVAGLDEATEILQAKFTGLGWSSLAGNVAAILRALVTADLLRLDSRGDFVHRPSLREGILQPVRRAIMIMLVAPGPVPSRYLYDRHVKRRYPDVTRDEADESFKFAKAALTSQWHIADAKDDRLTVRPQHPLVIDAEDKGRAIERAVRHEMSEQDIAAAVGAPWFSARWLRVLADAQVLEHHPRSKTWSPGRYNLK